MKLTSMNKDAAKLFRDKPEEKYWYYSKTLRVANPRLRRQPEWVEDPWPEVES